MGDEYVCVGLLIGCCNLVGELCEFGKYCCSVVDVVGVFDYGYFY